MKTFLISIQKQDNSFSIHQRSQEIKILDEDDLFILYTGEDSTKLSSISKTYKNKGISVLESLNGAFSCLIYDKLKQQLFIAKDKVGIEPLYYANTNNQIIVGSHLKEFTQVKNFQALINPSSVGDYMQFGFVLQPNTIFKECYKVCSGEYVCFDLNLNSYHSKKYWELESCYEMEKTTEEDALQKTKNLLEQAVESSTMNSQFSVSLSGGYDSSTLAALCQEQSEQKIDTFTIGFHEQSINEAPDAKRIAKHLGTHHTEYYFTEEDALELIPKMSQIYDEPFADHATAPTILTSQLLKKNKLNNLIAGDGGDEVFATAENVHALNRLQNTPIFLKKLLAKSVNSIKFNGLATKQDKLSQLLLAPNIPQMIYSRNILFMESELQMNIKDYSKSLKNSFDNINFKEDTQAVNQVIGSYFKTTMVDGELMKSYAAMNYENIKLSTPFLNIKLIEQMAKVPSSIKIKNDIKKYLLKEIAHSYIPKELIDRPKSGFDIPFSSWMRGVLKDILYSQINKKRLDEDNIFYTSSILNIRDQFYAGNDAYKYKLWRIFIFQLWYENFINSINTKG